MKQTCYENMRAWCDGPLSIISHFSGRKRNVRRKVLHDEPVDSTGEDDHESPKSKVSQALFVLQATKHGNKARCIPSIRVPLLSSCVHVFSG